MLTCAGWPNGKNLASLSSTKVNAGPRKSMQVGGQTKRKSKTCVDLGVRLVRALHLMGQADAIASMEICGKKKKKKRKEKEEGVFCDYNEWQVIRVGLC